MQLLEPRFMKEGYAFIDEATEQWKLKADAPAWAVKEFATYFKQVNNQGIYDIPEIDIGHLRTYYINDDGHLVDD